MLVTSDPYLWRREMITVYYWPCGTWCFPFELGAFNDLSDDFGILRVSPTMDDEQISLRVAIRLTFGE